MLDIRSTPVLDSHTLETALQEIAALLLASAAVAAERVEAAGHLKVPVRHVSFYKLLIATRELWAGFQLAGRALTPSLKKEIWSNDVAEIRGTALLPERRGLSGPRALRQASSP